MVGLYYQPHYRFKARQLSPYTETFPTDQIENLPENARYFETENLWRWRDLYPHGYVDPDGFGTNYPYMNDIHYVQDDINFYLRNEVYYTNKKDGITAFDNTKSADDCARIDPNVPVHIDTNPPPSATPSVTPTKTPGASASQAITTSPTISECPAP